MLNAQLSQKIQSTLVRSEDCHVNQKPNALDSAHPHAYLSQKFVKLDTGWLESQESAEFEAAGSKVDLDLVELGHCWKHFERS